jgi:hypothetical protein
VLALYTLLSAIVDDNCLLEDTAVESGGEVNFNRKSQVNGNPTEVRSTTLLTRDGVLKQGLYLRVRGLFEGVVMGKGN